MDQSCVSLLSGRVGGISLKAGTQCLSRLRRSLRKQTEKSLFSAPQGKALQKQANLHKDKTHSSAATHVSNRNIKYRRTQSRELPGLGPYLFIREKPPLLFCRFRFANSYMQWTHGARLQKHLRNRHGTMLHWTCNVFRAYGGNHGSKPQLWRVPFHKGNPTEAISQSDAQRLFAPTAFPKKALIQS